ARRLREYGEGRQAGDVERAAGSPVQPSAAEEVRYRARGIRERTGQVRKQGRRSQGLRRRASEEARRGGQGHEAVAVVSRFSYHLECSACAEHFNTNQLINLCRKCSAPLLVIYDLKPAPELRDEIRKREPTMWRYAEVLPGVDPIKLGEGITPLLRSKLFNNVWIKDESKNPTRSFKSRGMAAAVSVAKANGARSLAAPSAGNAGA